MINKEVIKAVGFDLDGTLYKSTPEIDDRVRNEIARKILEKRPGLERVEEARQFFEDRYLELHSGSRILREVGYTEPKKVMDECLATADVLDLLKKDSSLIDLITHIREQKDFLYIVTSSPTTLANQKLARLGINPATLNEIVCSDTNGTTGKSNGSTFQYLLGKTHISAQNHIYIGDRKNSDILPANKLGMQTISVWNQIEEADAHAPTIYEIKPLIT